MAKRIRPSIQLINPEVTTMIVENLENQIDIISEETATAEVAEIVEETATAEVAKAVPGTRPVSLRASYHQIRNPSTGVLYSQATVNDLNDLNAPESHFERSQIECGVLVIVKG